MHLFDWWICFSPEDGSGGDSGAGEDPPPGNEPPVGDPDPGGQEEDEVVPKSELAKANAEAAKYRRSLREKEKEIEQYKDAEKTELEREKDKARKAEERVSDLENKQRKLRVRVLAEDVGIMREARSDAADLLDWSKIEDPDDDAEVTVALRNLAKEKPYLVGTAGGADGGAGGRGPETTDMNQLLRTATGR